MNALSAQFQKALAELVGPVAYLKLMGRKAGETVQLIDPRIVEQAGRLRMHR